MHFKKESLHFKMFALLVRPTWLDFLILVLSSRVTALEMAVNIEKFTLQCDLESQKQCYV